MYNLDFLSRQHDDITTIIEEIGRYLKPDTLGSSEQAKEVRKWISILAGKLRVHMQAEDNHLYPKLVNHSEEQIRKVAKVYIEQMGDLASVFSEFNETYRLYSYIQANSYRFIQDTQKILRLLSERISKENKNLYVLLR